MTQTEATLFMYNDVIKIFLVASIISLLTMPLVFVVSIRAGKDIRQTAAYLITNTMMNYPFFLLLSVLWLTLRRF